MLAPKKSEGHVYFLFCFVIWGNFFPHHPSPNLWEILLFAWMELVLHGPILWGQWGHSSGGWGESNVLFGSVHCLAIQPMNWLVQVVFTGARKLQFQTQTCISKHHHLGLASSIPLNPSAVQTGHLGQSASLADTPDPGCPANSLCWGAI